jgi:O-antigen biosynthesis protein WbqP
MESTAGSTNVKSDNHASFLQNEAKSFPSGKVGCESSTDPMPAISSYRLPLEMKRFFDFCISGGALLALSPLLLLIAAAVKFTSIGPVLYWSARVGRGNRLFEMPKFRSMRINTPAVATHLLQNPDQWLTPIGSFLRKSSLDELPQLWSILKGDMSLVGPRPALFNQGDLIAQRTQQGIHELVPGLTGWAQVNGRDELPIPDKVKLDAEYLRRGTMLFDLWILWLTLEKVVRRDGVSH